MRHTGDIFYCVAGTSSLLLLNVRGNLLTGSPKEVEQCTELVQLDLSGNKFTGSLPATTEW
jgi:Leucine-rich repeat (LRR) protein